MAITVNQVLGYDGLIEAKRRHQTGRVVSIYDGAAQGFDTSDGVNPYTVLCEDHGGAIAVERLAQARGWATEPLTWCEGCQALQQPAQGKRS